MGQMTPRGGSHSRVTGRGETIRVNGLAHTSATIQMYMKSLQGPGIQKALNLITDAFAAMEYERFTSSGTAPTFGINEQWYPDTDEWEAWKSSHGYETGVLRFTNALMQSATHPKMTPVGQKGMRLTFGGTIGKDGKDYGWAQQNGETRSGIVREWVTINEEFRAVAKEIMEMFALPSDSEIAAARKSVRDEYGIKKIPKIKVHEDKRKGRQERDLRYRQKQKAIRDAQKVENNVKSDIQGSRTVGESGAIGRKVFTHKEYADYSHKTGAFGKTSSSELQRYHQVAQKNLTEANAQASAGKMNTREAVSWAQQKTMRDLGLQPELTKILFEHRRQVQTTRSSRAADGMTGP